MLRHYYFLLQKIKTGIRAVFNLLKNFMKFYQILPPQTSFGGLVVSVLASGSRVRGFEPGRSRRIFSVCKKILGTPSFGGEVK
jgi:hypothetical protein